MKTTTIIIAAVLTLSVNVLFAETNNESAPVSKSNTEIILTSLAPSLPSIATFEDAVTINDYGFLAPVTPAEAQFEEMNSEMDLVLSLAPVTPAVADFEEFVDFSSLAPVTPAEAEFE
jgi:hypothetical protein